jgi:hypothetical protein
MGYENGKTELKYISPQEVFFQQDGFKEVLRHISSYKNTKTLMYARRIFPQNHHWRRLS